MATITEDYVSFEIAKLLKEKGFDESTSMVYMSYDHLCKLNRYDSIRNSNYNDITKNYFEYTAPTLQMAMKWLREVYNIVIGVNVLNENNKGNTDYSNPDRWWYFWEFTDTKGVYKEELHPDPLSNEYSTYEEAAEAAIKYCLENLVKV